MTEWFSVPVVDGILIGCNRNRIWKSSKLCTSNKIRMFSLVVFCGTFVNFSHSFGLLQLIELTEFVNSLVIFGYCS